MSIPQSSGLFPKPGAHSRNISRVYINKDAFLRELEAALALTSIVDLRDQIFRIIGIVNRDAPDITGILNIVSEGETVTLRKDVLISELKQIAEARTISRARYYVERLQEGVSRVRTNKISDLNLARW